jgi:hypothetical protein
MENGRKKRNNHEIRRKGINNAKGRIRVRLTS